MGSKKFVSSYISSYFSIIQIISVSLFTFFGHFLCIFNIFNSDLYTFPMGMWVKELNKIQNLLSVMIPAVFSLSESTFSFPRCTLILLRWEQFSLKIKHL